mmetsp:Transcript_31229/g.56862  ORF Transcript_31229/g.56862 Transcript_31229/m.56862 type:complete len:257 (+) Transcript_31229:1-771(+)
MVLAHGRRGDGVSQEMRNEHWKWLQETLKKQRADWIIVVGHHPIFSAADHGNSKALRETLLPMLRHYGADAYIAGHDHNQQLLLEDGGPTHIVSGAASKLRTWIDKKHPFLRFADVSHGFISMRLNKSHLSSSWLNQSGQVRHVHVQQPQRKPWWSGESAMPEWSASVDPPPVAFGVSHVGWKAKLIIAAACLVILGILMRQACRRSRFKMIGAGVKPSDAREVCPPDAEVASLRMNREDIVEETEAKAQMFPKAD